MVCLYCGGETSVANSRWQRRNNQVWRRRQCLTCRAVFTTHEAIDLSSTLLVETGRQYKPFESDLLFTELLLALQDRKDCYQAAREATHAVIARLLKLADKPLFKTTEISSASSGVLKSLDRRAWLRYSAEHPSLQA
jgi:transcriptional repressor NrdR